MAESHLLGKKGEDLAAGFLADKGYKILHRNWLWGQNELDIIASDNSFIVFVEVKTRSADYYMHPTSAVTPAKQKSIIRAADGYLRCFAIDRESRFDVITIVDTGKTFEIDHIEGAFYPTLR